MRHTVPTRQLPAKPDLDQLRRQSKELLAAVAAGDADALAEVNLYYRDANPADFALHDAQLVIARTYGFDSWPKLKAYVEGATVRRLVQLVQANDLPGVRAMLAVRPELGAKGTDNYQVLHFAVLERLPEMVRVLMQYGANAREGVYPHRDATSALTIARERGYYEIVAIIEEEEQRRMDAQAGLPGTPSPAALFRAIASQEDDRAIAMLQAEPALVRARDLHGWTALHIAACSLNVTVLLWLVEHGAEPAARANDGKTPLDLAAERADRETSDRFATIAATLGQHGAELTPRAAVTLDDSEWLRARHLEGALSNAIDDSGGLLRIAVSHDRPEILSLLLEFGFDPDERMRFGDSDEPVFSWGMPLWHCAGSRKYAMAEMLLKQGADANARVYASGSPMFQAYGEGDRQMVHLLEKYGGLAEATTAGLFRQTALAKDMLDGKAKYCLDSVGGDTLSEQLLWGAACGGDPEIVRLALERIDSGREDPRWFPMLEQPLRFWKHGSASEDWDRRTYLSCFRLLLQRCDPNTRGRFGLTILHSVAGAREHVAAEDRVAFASALLDAGARMDIRDNLLKSTPLGWSCRWGRVELVRLLLERGAPAVEPDAEPWAAPLAWAEKMRHYDLLAILREAL